MRRLAIVFVVISLASTMLRIVTPERIAAAAVRVAEAPVRFQRALLGACRLIGKRLRPLLPQAN